MFIAVLILLISMTSTATAADNIIFSEDWESGRINPSKWVLGGSPSPQLRAGGLNSIYALDSNGDNTCDSAAYAGEFFFTPNGLSAEFWLKLPDCLWCSTPTSRTGFATIDLINSGPCTPNENYYQGLAYVELNGSTGVINYIVEPFGSIFAEPYPDNQWHRYKVQINSTGIVDFYMDDQLKASSNPLNLNLYLGVIFQHWGQRNFEPHLILIDDITIAQPESGTGNLLFDSEVDNYTVVSIDPPGQLPPQPLKGNVRITVKMQAFVDFGAGGAVVISITSLDEQFRLGDGAIQAAVPENVSPIYDSIMTTWEYYNPDCGEPVDLEIIRTPCNNNLYLTELNSRLYPTSSAENSALGLDGLIECLDNDYPYQDTLFSALNTHDTVNDLWLDPANRNCPDGESHDGKEITILIPIQESVADALAAFNESKMALNAKFSIANKSDGMIYEIDILADQLSP